jgi:protein-disulfide isomerase
MKRVAAVLALVTIATAAMADEAAVRRLIQSRVGAEVRIEAIERVPGSGLYEVTVRGPDGPQLFYVDERARVIVVGQVLDGATGLNFTEERLRKLNAIDWARLVALGRKLGASSTPTWFVETGERYSGAISLEDTRRFLDAASRAKGAK